MDKYYKIDNKENNWDNKGTKEKYWYVLNGKRSLIKFNRYDNGKETRSFNVSEKIFSKIAKFLEF